MINSATNKQVKRVIGLRARAKARKEEGMFVAEGLRMCRELSPEEADILYVTEGFLEHKENQNWLKNFQYETVSDAVMKTMADTQTPQGVLAVVKQKNYSLEEILDAPLRHVILILEALQDPGNLGTILRAGEGAGITGVIMNRETADIYNPKVIRSTMGSILRVPFVYVDNLGNTCDMIKKRGIRLFAAYLKAMNNYDQEDYTGNVGFLIGNEAKGLTVEMAACADVYVKIPMAGKVESLNAATAASVLMFEVARQRRQGRSGRPQPKPLPG